jgi:hypothetical protein
LVGVALQQGTIFTDIGEVVCRLGVEVKNLKSTMQGGASAVAARSGRPRVADGGLLGEEIIAISVHLPRKALHDGILSAREGGRRRWGLEEEASLVFGGCRRC